MVPAVIAGLFATSAARATTVSPPDPSAEAAFASKIAYERSSRGLAPLKIFAELTSVARNHSEQMASQQQLSDDNNLANEVQNWQTLGGNAGEGPSVDQVHAAFMASPSHRQNILDPMFTDLGIGVVWTGSTLWVTEVFRQEAAATAQAAAATPPPPPPPPAPSTTSATVARPATRRAPAPAPVATAPTTAAPPTTVPAPPTTPPTAALSAGAVPSPDRFATGTWSQPGQGPPGDGGHSLIALGAPIRLPSPHHVPFSYLSIAVALVGLDLAALLLAARRGWLAALIAPKL
jgi:Cysteine-rich secretory protein family